MKDLSLKAKTVGIVSHIYTTGPALRLENYLVDKSNQVIFIGHPFSFRADTRSFWRHYENGQLKGSGFHWNWSGPEIIFYLRDVWLTIWWLLLMPKCDLLICFDNLNTFSGWLLKKLGKVDKLVFYTIDYVPQRFPNNWLNNFYHWLDRFALEHADITWNVSNLIAEEREKRGVDHRYLSKQIEVPIGIENYPLVTNKYNPNQIVFLGHLRPKQGVEMLLQAMTLVKTKHPSAELVIVGGGPLESSLRKQAINLGLKKTVTFTGFVDDFAKVEKILVQSAIGVAPYTDDDQNFTRFADPAKPKDYMASGLAVVITNVPRIAQKISQKKCGLLVEDNAQALAEGIIKLLKDKKFLAECRKNALQYAQQFSTESIYSQALRSTYE